MDFGVLPSNLPFTVAKRFRRFVLHGGFRAFMEIVFESSQRLRPSYCHEVDSTKEPRDLGRVSTDKIPWNSFHEISVPEANTQVPHGFHGS